MNGTIFNIQRFCTNDGPGIRTTVFLKGCPLRCDWCHNPESQSTDSEIMFYKDKCTGCGRCAEITAEDKDFICFNQAKEICGKETTVNEVIKEIIKDKIFYDNSHGGITLSGGEPLFQYDFSLELLKKAKESHIHTAVETCGYTEKSLLEMNRYVDLWLYDIKISDDELHKKYTGVSNAVILKNLELLDSIGAEIILRCPIIPDINMENEHFEALARLSNSLENVKCIQLEPYHPLGVLKAVRLGRKQKYNNDTFLDKKKLIPFVEKLSETVSIDVEIL